MDYFINTKTFQYVGETPFKFKDCLHKETLLLKGDTITLENNHYARFLANKECFIQITPKLEKAKEKRARVEKALDLDS